MKWIASAVVVVAVWATFGSTPAGALSLKIAPLEYRATLDKGEIKKGFVDISNPDSREITVAVEAQAFRQIDNEGSLEFVDDEQISAGVKLDYREIKLGPREAVRMAFLLDGTKLPSGDVFAAILASVKPPAGEAGSQSVRVGTLLQIVNGTPGERSAEVTSLDVPRFQIGEKLVGSYAIKNTADPKSASGFRPEVTITLEPFALSQPVESSLLFAGRERSNDFELIPERFGVYRVTASYGDSSQQQWVILLNWWGVMAIFALILVVAAAAYGIRKFRR